MNLSRCEPYRDQLTLHDRMSRQISDPYLRLSTSSEAISGWFPPVDIHEESDSILLRAEVPGVAPDDIEMSVDNGTLTLRGEKKQEKETESESAYRLERFYGSFTRSFVLPAAVDPERMNATCKDGVLEVVL